MVRPRLVEEGKPLTECHTSDEDDEDHEMDLEEEAPETPAAVGNAASASAEAAPTSSLLRALGGKLPPTRRPKSHKRPTHIEIGEEQHHLAPEPLSEPPSEPEPPSAPEPAHAFTMDHHHPWTNSNHTMTMSRATHTRTHIEIGADDRPTERMQGVVVHSTPLPLVVVDGANVAYAYAQALHPNHNNGRLEPDVRGLAVVAAFFPDQLVRLRVVLPASFVRAKPRTNDPSQNNALMQTDRLEILQTLQRDGKLVPSPPTDDDDAYCLTIAQREIRKGRAPAFVLSNDFFRDAQARDNTGQLKHWLSNGVDASTGPGRISYTFCDLGQLDDYGDAVLDLVPNPRHPLIAWMETNATRHPPS